MTMDRRPAVCVVIALVAAVAGWVLLARAHGYLAAAPTAIALVAAVAVTARSPVGRTLAGRVALGVVVVAAAAVISVASPIAAVPGVVALGAWVALLRPEPAPPASMPAFAPAIAAVCAGVLAVPFFAAAGLHLLLAVLLVVASGVEGPGRFALTALAAALSVASLYFLAVSGAGVVPVVAGGLFAVAAVAGLGPAGKARSAESSDGPRRVR